MKVNILPIKKIPEILLLGGDYRTTQAALLLAAPTASVTKIINAGKSIDTEKTIRFLRKLNCTINIKDTAIEVEGRTDLTVDEEFRGEYLGGIFPLSIIIGMMAGFNRSCLLKYSPLVSQDIVDTIIGKLNRHRIDVHHEADEYEIIFRASAELPIESKMHSSLSAVKNCLLMFGIISGNRVTVEEMLPASAVFEDMIRRFGGQLSITDPKVEVIQDPDDPRKKKKIKHDDFFHRLMLSPSVELTPTEIIVPADADIVNALLTLAVLRRKKICITDVNINSDMTLFLNYLKSLGAELNISDRKTENGYALGNVTINHCDVKARRFSGVRASSLIDNIPFMAILAALGSGTTIIRDVAEFHEWGVEPNQEIADNLKRIGVKCGVLNDGLAVEGRGEIRGGDFGPFNNGGIALAFYMAALAGEGGSGFEGYELVKDHYPEIISVFGDKAVTQGTQTVL